MEFVRKRKRGQNRKVRRTWFAEEGYRIVWRKEAGGVAVPARFQASVRVVMPRYFGADKPVAMWDFVNRNHRLYKTLKAAQEDCEKHQRLWLQACEATGIRQLQNLFGRLPIAVPVWALKKINRIAYALLMESRPLQREEEEDECPIYIGGWRRTEPKRCHKSLDAFRLPPLHRRKSRRTQSMAVPPMLRPRNHP